MDHRSELRLVIELFENPLKGEQISPSFAMDRPNGTPRKSLKKFAER
jgi:hypothetical protein